MIKKELAEEVIEALVKESKSYAGTLTAGMSLVAIALEQKGLDEEKIHKCVDDFLLAVTEITTREQDMLVIKEMVEEMTNSED